MAKPYGESYYHENKDKDEYTMRINYIIKRDGRKDAFNPDKIKNAILLAMDDASDGEGRDVVLAERLTIKVTDALDRIAKRDNLDTLPVDKVHDTVEEALMKTGRPAVAQEYIRFRNKRDLARKADTLKIFDSIVKAQANEITRENANMNADTPAGMMMKFASEASKSYVDQCLLSDTARHYVAENLLHIHDKDYYPTKSLTCIQHPTDKLLREGFVDGHASVRPARRIETAATIACISLEAVQNEMHGGQAIPAFDFYMAPYVRMAYEEELDRIAEFARIEGSCPMNKISEKDGVKHFKGGDWSGRFAKVDFEALKKAPIKDYIKAEVFGEMDPEKACMQLAVNRTVKRVHQAMESFVHNMNTIHSRGGNQVVFSSINYGTDTSAEGRCVIREMLNTTYEGVGNGETAIFPIQIWKKKKGVSYLPGDPNYDLYRFAVKVTARRFFPNYLNLDATYNYSPEWREDDPQRYVHEVATMGCRTRVFENRFGPVTSIGRGNLSFSTINLPGLAIRCMEIKEQDKRIEAFFSSLKEVLDATALQLHQRFEFQKTALAKQFPMLMHGLWNGSEKLGPDDEVGDVINQGTLGIGFIGLAECLIALTGHHHGESPEAQALGLRIISFMRDHVNIYCNQYKHNYSVLATPAEGLAGRFTKIDRKRFGVVSGVTDKDYYTNSNHVPVYYKCTPEEKARIEGPYHEITRGGHIFYVEFDVDATHNPEAVMQIVDLMDKYNIGYGSINHNRARCLDCGYESAEKDLHVCPKCGSTHVDLLQRITGYLVGTTDRWNSGKLAELRDRVPHTHNPESKAHDE